MRLTVLLLIACVTGVANAQTPQSPPGAFVDGSAFRTQQPILEVRGTGTAPAAVVFSARLAVSRQGKTEQEARAQLDAILAATKSSNKVKFVRDRPEAARPAPPEPVRPVTMVPARTPEGAPIPPPQPPQSTGWIVFTQIEVEASSRALINEWAASLPAISNGSYFPSIIEKADPADPAWQKASDAAMAAARDDARIGAKAAGADLGPMLRMNLQRGQVADGMVSVTVNVTFGMNRR